MKWASALSEAGDLETAVSECITSIKKDFGILKPDLAIAFISDHHSGKYEELPNLIRQALNPRVFIGCSAGGVIGGGVEVEQRWGFSLTVASLPGVDISSFHVDSSEIPDMDAPPNAWHNTINLQPESNPYFILLGEPASFPMQSLVSGLDYAFPLSVKVGGLASALSRRNINSLFLNDTVYRSGAIGVALTGNVIVDTVVAQGCRPIGDVLCITKSHQNVLMELNGRPPLESLKELFASSGHRDRELMQGSLFVGIVMDELIDQPKHGDFLIRNLLGIDADSGMMSVGEILREGQIVQFHLRDSVTSADDLGKMLSHNMETQSEQSYQGALLFSCLGRGEHLYGRPNHDSDMFKSKLGNVPLGGFFCSGEIGPISGNTFIHGYTSSFGLFRPAQA